MENQSLKSPEGRDLFLIANKTTTDSSNKEIKKILTQRELIEVIVSDSKILSYGSNWGHVAIFVDGKIYSRAHEVYFTTNYDEYINRNSYRDSIGIVLAISPREKEIIKKELDRRVFINKKYDLLNNSCSSNVEDVLELIDILAHDPRGLPELSTPAEILSVVSKSKRVVKKIPHQKK